MTKSVFYNELSRLAEELRKQVPDYTKEKAFAVTMLETDAGRSLYAAHRMAPADALPPAPEPLDISKAFSADSAFLKLRKAAEEFRTTENGRGLSTAQAYARIIKMPENRELFEQAKIDGMRAAVGATA